jgi:hypothetical protein
MIVRVDGHYSHIECDEKGCHEQNPPMAVMTQNHGLSGCGWSVAPGRHMCPKHYFSDALAQGPQERTASEQAKIDRKREKRNVGA